MEHLLFAGYLILFAWLITKIRFFSRSGLTAAQLVIIFLIKVMSGIFYGWVGVYYGDMARMVDTWYYHYQSLPEWQLLQSRPLQYFHGLFQNDYSDGYSGFLGAEGSWWNDLDVTFMLKMLGLFNTASQGHYYVNVIFYAFVTLFGPVALYRVFNHYYNGTRLALLPAIFFIPSFIYWTSGLHKEGLIFNCIALPVYAFYFGWQRKFTAGKAIVVVVCLLLLLVLRSYLALMLLAALLAWLLARQLKGKPVVIFALVYLFFAIAFFAAPYIAGVDFAAAVVDKQRQFSELRGNSEVPVAPLQPSVQSFLANMPQAVQLSILKPGLADIRHLLSLAAAIEINGLLLLFALYLFWRLRAIRHDPFSLFCLFFTATVLLIIGYTVNFLGAIVRYRSVVLPLLFVPVLAQLPWSQLAGSVLNIKRKNNIQNR